MDSYIVRIYRRDDDKSSPSRGIVEKVGDVGQETFGTMEELWKILSIKRRKFKGRNDKKQE